MHAMETVQVFNDELQSLLGSKPSVSKAKMVQITRAAMKGVKFYKHIVQAVEKFIARCRPEYMIPGLYVIDSIVRQSRHQFGPDRDVYSARFSRNIMMTFETLFANCLPDDKPKIVRVLNLWQKNGVFESLIVQPLMDMASSTSSSSARAPPSSPPDEEGGRSHNRYAGRNADRQSGAGTDGELKFSKYMLDFDYDEDDDAAGDETPTEAEPPLSSTLNKMGIEHRGAHRSGDPQRSKLANSQQSQQRVSENAPQTHHKPQPPPPPPAVPQQDPVLERWHRIVNQQPSASESLNMDKHASSRETRDRSRSRSPSGRNHHQPSQPPGGLKSVEQSQEKDNKTATTTITASSTTTTNTTMTDVVAKDAARCAERERRCLPDIRDKHITVCSATLWLGHVPKSVTEVDLSDTFGEFGSIHSIDLVPPRGCAYVCMDRRQDAKRALTESKDIRLKGNQIKMAWAPGKGFKEYKNLKDFWEADVGASFIPYSRVDGALDFETLEEGGVIDEDSLSIEMRERRERQARDKKSLAGSKQQQQQQAAASQQSQSGLSQPLPHMPVLNQPVPPTSIQQFNMPPPNMSIPPPPMALGQGLIHFPPPGVTTSSSGAHQMILPPPSMAALGGGQSSSGETQVKGEDPSTSIDHQLSMTERQISMVEQQLSMIQQAQGMQRVGGPPMQVPMQGMANPQQQAAMFQQLNQPDPMIFNMTPMQPQMMHAAQQMLEPALQMFANHHHHHHLQQHEHPHYPHHAMHMMGPPQMMMPPPPTSMAESSEALNAKAEQSIIQID